MPRRGKLARARPPTAANVRRIAAMYMMLTPAAGATAAGRGESRSRYAVPADIRRKGATGVPGLHRRWDCALRACPTLHLGLRQQAEDGRTGPGDHVAGDELAEAPDLGNARFHRGFDGGDVTANHNG